MALDLSLIGKPTAPVRMTYTWRDTVLYALGIGARKDELDYLYEGRGPKVYPSFAVVPMFGPMFELVGKLGGNVAMIVHGGQRVEIAKPLPPEGMILTTATLRAAYDLRRFAIVLVDTETRDEAGDLMARTTANIVFRGEGNFGGSTPPKEEPPVPAPAKDRAPDFRIEEPTSAEQALLYRLSGDHNPLHADPSFATNVGFPQGPILHGLCTYGFMVRHVARAMAGGDGSRVVAFDASFKRPVWPGDTLVTSGWDMGEGRIALSVSVKERDEVVVAGAWARLV